MENLNSPSLIWFILGFVLLILEFLVPGLILVFFGAAAWILALILLFADLSLDIQIILFLVLSLSSVSLLRKYIRRKSGNPSIEQYSLETEILGKTAKAETAIPVQGTGRVFLNGTSWMAVNQGEEEIAAHQEVVVKGWRSITLLVERKK